MKQEEYAELRRIKWEPEYACFQLSSDKRYARHEKLPTLNNDFRLRDVVDEIYKAWNLRPYAQDDIFYYFH